MTPSLEVIVQFVEDGFLFSIPAPVTPARPAHRRDRQAVSSKLSAAKASNSDTDSMNEDNGIVAIEAQ
jgi:hypothetical protein